MFKFLLLISVFVVFACAEPGVVVAPAVPVHHGPVVHHHGAHAVHSHVIHHPAPVVVKPVVAHHVVKPVVPVVPLVKPVVVKPLVPVLPVHHAHPAVIAHH